MSGTRRRTVIGTAENSWERGQECVFRFPGMSEKTQEVWIAGQQVEIVEATMEGVKVRMPPGLVTFRNAGDEVPRKAGDPASLIMKKAPEVPKGEAVEEELQEGLELHKAVPMDSWCITLEDLKELRRLVQRAVRDGLIKPKDGDFDPKDEEKGPNIYTVNEQFIKKITRAKGGMSWALMKHRGGLKCDLFVTHCWEEGIYEFLDKVIHSWPKGAKNAYCCMLANPQNLDIGSLIGKPSDSPFAKALISAEKMMVVPNTRSSIYTRLWCAYEAYTAYTADKFIFTARQPASVAEYLWSIAMVALLLFYGQTVGGKEDEFELGLVFLLVSLVSPAREKYVCWCVGAGDAFRVLKDRHCPKLLKAFNGMLLAYFVGSAVLQINVVNAKRASEELKNRYRGSIRYATCSRQADELAIREEMEQGDEKTEHRGNTSNAAILEVDKTIKVLMDVGMSTTSLRGAVAANVEMEEALYTDWLQTGIGLIWTAAFIPFFGIPYNTGTVMAWVLFVCDMLVAAVLLIRLLHMDLDKQALSAAYLQKFSFVPLFLSPITQIYFMTWYNAKVFDPDWSNDLAEAVMWTMFFAPALCTKLLSAALMRMDFGEIAEKFGPDFAQFFVTKGSKMPRFLAKVALKLGKICVGHMLTYGRRWTSLGQQLREVEIELGEVNSAGMHLNRDVASSATPADAEDDRQSAAAWDSLIASIELKQ